MATLEKALQIAAKAHEGQKDKEGLPYILHPLRVMGHVEGSDAQIVAVLHDVVEDTAVTLDDLRAAGFGETVLAAVACVTHRKDQPYADYVIGCKDNPVARQVKLGDLADNCRLAAPARPRPRPDSPLLPVVQVPDGPDHRGRVPGRDGAGRVNRPSPLEGATP